MGLFDLYNKKMTIVGDSYSKQILEENKEFYNQEFKNDPSYRLATINHPTFENQEIDIRLANKSNTVLEKRIHFRPDVELPVGTLITVNPTEQYIIMEYESNQVSPFANVYKCNQFLNRHGWDAPEPCYSTNSSYGDKGVIEGDLLSEVDGKVLHYVQDNERTRQIQIEERFVFDHDFRQTYKVVKTETVTNFGFDGVRKIVMSKTESSDKDDLENNIAYNDFLWNNNKPSETPDTYNLISNNGRFEIKKWDTNTFKIVDTDGNDSTDVWTIDIDYNGVGSSNVSIVRTTDNSISIKNIGGAFENPIIIVFTLGGNTLSKEIKLIK